MKEIKRLDKTHHGAFKEINYTVLETLASADWFIPLPEPVLEAMFTEESKLIVYGCFVDGVLAAVSLLDFDQEEFQEVAEAAGVDENKRGAELGVCMVLPAYRGQNLMLGVNRVLLKAAKEMGLAYCVATAHPDNAASNASLRKLGMEYKTTIIRQGHYERNVYLMEF